MYLLHPIHTRAARRMYLLRKKMIQVSGPVHGGSPPFKQESIGIATIKNSYHQNGRQHRKQTQLFKCNGQVDVKALAPQASPLRSQHAAHKIRFSPNPKSSISKRPSPIKDMHCNIAKLEPKQSIDSTFNLLEPILFAGSKSCVTPSPSDLPKPPVNWMNKSARKLSSTEVVPLDLSHDSAVLAVGTEKRHLLALRSILK